MFKIKSKLAMVLASALALVQPVIAQASEFAQSTAHHAHVVVTKYLAAIGGILFVDSITQAFVQQFDNTIRLQAQQSESRLEGTVTDRGNIVGESFTANQLAPLDDTPEKQGRHADTVWDDINHGTRVGLMRDFYQALPIDRNDEPKVLANPNGAYMTSLLNAWNRRKDRIIFDALIGNAQTKEGSLIALPNNQVIVHGSTGFTKAKAIQAKKLFRANEADSHSGEELFMIYTADMMEDILADTTLTSADFLAAKMLQEGDVSGKWLGFKWIPYEAIKRVGNVQSTAAYTKSALHKGQGFFQGNAQRRGDKQDTMQLSAAGSLGAVRVEEAKVIEIQFQ